MLKKSLLTIAFLSAAVIMTGCNSSKKAEVTEPAPAAAPKVDYIVTVDLPQAAAEGTVDKANAAYVKIYPHFDRAHYAGQKEKIQWFKTGLGSKVPAMKDGKLLEVINTDKDFAAYIGFVDAAMFEQYFKDLAAAGFLFQGNTGWDNMTLYNDAIEINLRFSQDGNNVTTVRARVLTPEEILRAKANIAKAKEEREKQAK